MDVTKADVLLETLKTHGVEYVFCSPGSEWMPVWENFAKRYGQGDKTLKYINCRHESLAVSAAIGYAKASGRLPAVLLHANVGTLNAAVAIRTAYWAQVPMIICGGDTSSYGEHSKDGAQWLNRLCDIGRTNLLVKSYVKWSNAVISQETLLDSIYRGCQIANTVPRGPAFVSIPWELLLEMTPEVKPPQPYQVSELPAPNTRDVKNVANQLLQSNQPIIITENAGQSKEVVSKVVELAELLSIPVFESVDPAFGNFPKDHPLHLGYDVSQALPEADAVFIVGGITPWHPPSAFPKNDARVILLDEHPIKERLPYWGYKIDLTVTANVGQWLTALLETIRADVTQLNDTKSHYKDKFEHWRKEHEKLRGKCQTEALAGQKSKPISHKWFLHIASKILPSNSLILSEATTHELAIRQYLADANRYFKVQYGGLGLGPGTAAGMKLASPDAPIILFVGDGALNYGPVVAGLGLCQEYHLPVLIVVLNNSGYISMKQGHKRKYPDGWAVKNNTYFGTDIMPSVNYAKIAQAFDSYGERLENPAEIEPAIKRALQQLNAGRIAVLDVILD